MKTISKILFPQVLVAVSVFGCATANEDNPIDTPSNDSATVDAVAETTSDATSMEGGGDSSMSTDSTPAMDTRPADATTCSAGKTETRKCGGCGSQSRFCLPDGVFSDWTDCVGERADAECKIGEKQTNDCGNCGKSTDYCDPESCTWVSGLCTGEGPCAPGDTDTTKASCPVADTVRTRTCDDKCQWGDFSTCDLPRGWLPMAATTIGGRAFHSAVWTGNAMIVWGGGYSSTLKNDGASYDLSANKWTAIATPSLSARRQHAAAWTGSKMIVWGGYDGSSSVYKDGAVYDPSTNSWSPMATSTLSARHATAAVWSTTTNEFIVWSGCTSGWCSAVASDGAAYDPATNTWSAIPAAPIVGRSDAAYTWSGSELIVWGGRTASGTYLTDGARFDPKTRVWTKFSDPPASVLDGRIDEAFGSNGTGGLFVWGGRQSSSGGTTARNTGAVYQPGVGWTAIPAPPSTVFGPDNKRYDLPGFMAGGKLYLFEGITSTAFDSAASGFASYDFASDTWSDVDMTGAPTPARDRSTIVWTGREAIIWGGLNGNTCCTTYANGAIYRP